MDDLDRFLMSASLADGWKVTAVHEIARDQPNRCRTYQATHPTKGRGFVKVLPPATGDLDQMRTQLDEFFYEKTIVELCADRNMRRVVRALAFDAIEIPGIIPTNLHYLVFEWGECDARALYSESDDEYFRAVIRCLHHVATALHELHFSNIAHQNLRPASVIRFSDDTHKVGDFRHSHCVGIPRPGAGGPPDATYAAPEILYGGVVSSFEERCAVDLYQLGSLGLTLLTGVGATAQLSVRLSSMHHWMQWRGAFGDVLPYLSIAHDEIIRLLNDAVPESIRDDLVRAIHQLTEPDPARRGHPSNIRGIGPRYGVERYVSMFDLLLKRLRVSKVRVAP